MKHAPVGVFELIEDDGTTVQCELVLMRDWRTKLPNLLAAADTDI